MQKWHINHVIGKSKQYTNRNRLYDGAAFSGPVVQYLAFRTLNHSSQGIYILSLFPPHKTIYSVSSHINNMVIVSETNQNVVPLSPKKARIQKSTQEVQSLLGESRNPKPDPTYRALKPEPTKFVNAQSLIANPSKSLTLISGAGDHRARVQLGSRRGGFLFRSGHQRLDNFPSSAGNSVGRGPQNPEFRLPRGNATARKSRSSPSSRDGSKRENSQNYEDKPVETEKKGSKSRRSFTKPPLEINMDWNEEELDYLEAKERSKIKPMVPYQPEQVSEETLSEMGPAIPVDERGLAEAVQRKLDAIERKRDLGQERLEILARLQIQGLKPNCCNKHETNMLKERVQQILTGDNPQPQESHQISDELKAEFINSIFGGDHAVPQADGGDVMGNVIREIRRNMSYLPEDRASFLKKVQTLLPPAAQAATAKEPSQART